MKISKTRKLVVCLATAFAAMLMMTMLCACGPKTITVNVVEGEASTEVSTQEGTTVSDILAEADIVVNEGDEVTPALDTKIEADGETITIVRLNKVVIAVDGNNIDVEVLGGTVQDALDKAEITLADGDAIDIEATTPLEQDMLITVTRAPKETPKASTSNKSGGSSGRTVVSRTNVPNCSGDGHGYYEITYSDGSTEIQEY